MKTIWKLMLLTALAGWAAVPSRAGIYYDNRVHPSSATIKVGYANPWTPTNDAVLTSSGAAVVQSTSPTAGHKVLRVKNNAGVDVLSVTQGGVTTSPSFVGNLTGTATSLAANGANCTAGMYPLGVDASGNSEGCTAAGIGDVVLASTQQFTGGNSFTGSTTFYGNVFGITTSSAATISFTGATASMGVAFTTITVASLTGFVDVCANLSMYDTGAASSDLRWGFLLNGNFASGFSATVGVGRTFTGGAGGVDRTNASGCAYRVAVPAGANTFGFVASSVQGAGASAENMANKFVVKQTQ